MSVPLLGWWGRRLRLENALLKEQLEWAEAEAKALRLEVERYMGEAERLRREMYRMAERYGEK